MFHIFGNIVGLFKVFTGNSKLHFLPSFQYMYVDVPHTVLFNAHLFRNKSHYVKLYLLLGKCA